MDRSSIDYAIKIYRRGKAPQWGYYRCDSLRGARKYASGISAQKVEIYSGSSGVSVEYFDTLIETLYPNKEKTKMIIKKNSRPKSVCYSPLSDIPVDATCIIGEVGIIFSQRKNGKLHMTLPFSAGDPDRWLNLKRSEISKRHRFLKRFIDKVCKMGRREVAIEKFRRGDWRVSIPNKHNLDVVHSDVDNATHALGHFMEAYGRGDVLRSLDMLDNLILDLRHTYDMIVSAAKTGV